MTLEGKVALQQHGRDLGDLLDALSSWLASTAAASPRDQAWAMSLVPIPPNWARGPSDSDLRDGRTTSASSSSSRRRSCDISHMNVRSSMTTLPR